MLRFRFVTNKTLRTWHHDPKTFYQMLQFNRLVQIKRLFPLRKWNTYTYIYIYYIYMLHISKYSNHEQINIVNPKTSPKKSTHQLQAISIVFYDTENHTICQPTRTCHSQPFGTRRVPPAGPKLVDRNAPRRHATPRVVGVFVEWQPWITANKSWEL